MMKTENVQEQIWYELHIKVDVVACKQWKICLKLDDCRQRHTG